MSRGAVATTALLVDDHRLFTEVLAARLRNEGAAERVETVYALDHARAVVNVLHPDVVLLDRQVGDDDGLRLLPHLSLLPRRPRVLVVSGRVRASDVVDTLAAGADGWIGKDSGIPLLLEAMATVMRGELYLPAAMLRPVVNRLLREGRHRAQETTFVEQLSARETDVLRCLVAGMTRAEAAARLFVSTNTIRTHVQNLLKRAEVHSTGALVAKARELGVPGIDEPAPPAARRLGPSSA
jgi:two-component system nitrate/nitrite response regulator NarL